MDKNALVLSGGGSRGAYEIGAWQALREMGIPIDIVTGASVGAINGAMVAQDDFDLAIKLWRELETHMVFDVNTDKKEEGKFDFEIAGMTSSEALAYAKEILTKGGAGNSGLQEIVKEYIDEEKVRKSNVELGIVTVEFPSMKPHYLFTNDIPQGKLHDYILASASCFPAVQTQHIDGIRFVDGGYVDVMPVELALEKGATNIMAVYLEAAGILRKDSVELAQEKADLMILIKSYWDLGNFLIFDTDNTKRIMRLGYLDTMKTLGIFDGKKFAFSKGEIANNDLDQAEAAAVTFKMDPTILYKERTFHAALSSKIKETSLPEIKEIRSWDDLRKSISSAALVLYIADQLKKKEADSIFTNRQAFRLFKEEVLSANYILKKELI